MRTWQRGSVLSSILFGLALVRLQVALPAEPKTAPSAPEADAGPIPERLTLDDIKQRILSNNKLLELAAANVQSKGYATRAVQANYFPQVIGQSVYLHFDDDLGTVLTTQGRTVTGPRGTPLKTFPLTSVNLPVVNQDTALNSVVVAQPLTDLLKVRQGVKLARADEGIARAQMEKGTRELLSGAEQLFWGIWAAQRIRDGMLAGTPVLEELAKTGNLEARTALVQGQQALQEVDMQIADLSEQLNTLIDVPICTRFELVLVALPVFPVRCADEAVALAVESSPEIHEAEENVRKVHAAVAAAKVDYVPSIAIVGGYLNQTAASYIQPNISYVGVMGSYTFVDWGKRRNTLREREQLVVMATLKVQQTKADVEQKALKAFRDFDQAAGAVKLAGELVELRKEAVKVAAAAGKLKAGKDLLTAEVDAVKAELNQRVAFAKLMNLIGKQ